MSRKFAGSTTNAAANAGLKAGLRWLRALSAAQMLLIAFVPFDVVLAQPAQLVPADAGPELIIALHKSHILELDQPLREVSVGDPEIADVVPLTTHSIYVLGKALGTTNVTITGVNGAIVAVVDVAVTFDIASLRQRLDELVPGEDIKILPAADALILSGSVSSQAHLRRILTVAERYAPERVTNLLSVAGSQQVLLKVRFAEIQRSVLKNIGANTDVTVTDGNDLFSLFSGLGIGPEAFGVLGGSITGGNGDITLDVLVDALEERGFIRTLAEPNIIALSGDTADFLAGGEFPIPVAQDSSNGQSSITIEFKQFGVGLAFTPTVVGVQTINLELNTEVSAIDESIRVTAGGVSVPGLRVRRTHTTVELQDGQSFAISGLIQDNFSDAVDRLPLLGELPVLGALFRSSSFRRQQTELVVIITAHLVQPVSGNILALPTERALPPGEDSFFIGGQMESPVALNAAGSQPEGYVLP